ncbi:hypothetical protein [Polymorphospora rubra]|uniref:Uncharacterized protein n=1 Tax=Polymorphospora rubra TaxID=338584 RepID=A0A810N7A5_9ACTN|nr:hypothetical protein [Polymorphospora rubra]BCJ67523.1 hypothetical protein Prubr_45440 [Polymorphospora rubra]
MAEANEAVAAVDWNRLFHAHGPATDTPRYLQALVSDDDAAVAAAYQHLWSAVLRPGTVWPATPPVARILATLIHDPRLGAGDETIRQGLLVFLRAVGKAVAVVERIAPVRESAYPSDASVTGAWLGAYLTADEEDRAALCTHPARDLVLRRAVVDCFDLLPELLDQVKPFLTHPSPAVRSCAVAAIGTLARHPAAAPDRPALIHAFEQAVRATDDIREHAALLIGIGELGGTPRAWLTDPRPGVRGCAALAPTLADDPAAIDVLVALSRSPRAFDRAFAPMLAPPAYRLMSLPQFEGTPRWALIDTVCARVADFERIATGALAVVPLAFRMAPCPDLGPFLEVAFADGWPTPDAVTPAQRALVAAVGEHDELWDPDNAYRQATLTDLGLPDDRERWQALGRPPVFRDHSGVWLPDGLRGCACAPCGGSARNAPTRHSPGRSCPEPPQPSPQARTTVHRPPGSPSSPI